ncbi:MAG: outer membrane beta-barrel protein [Gammaproteobacteria bacterium]|nr:outer membrane beta-barrel protein [Gammaproteobacteria bacterium]
MNKNKYIRTIFSLVTFFSFSSSYAEFDPAVVKAGGVEIVPVISVSQLYDSNYLYREADEKSAMLTLLKPKMTASVGVGANKYSLEAAASIGRNSENSADDYVDSQLAIDLNQSFSRKMQLDVVIERINTHEDRGTGYSSDDNSLLDEPDKYHITRFDGKFSYGSKDAIGRIVFNLSSGSRIYDNHRAVTKARDRNDASGSVTFFYHVMPKTSLLFELTHREFDYEVSTIYNSIEQQAYAGVSWDISALTTGSAKAGLLEKNFNDADGKDFSGFSWDIGVRWTPLSYSVIDVLTKGRTEETNGDGDYIDSKTVLTKWTHFWNERVDTVVSANITKNDYQPSSREDGILNIGIQANYNMRRWLVVGAGFSHSENRSTQAGFDYAKNVVSINLTAGL